MVIENPTYHHKVTGGGETKKFVKQINLFDLAVCDFDGSLVTGEITFMSLKFVNIKTSEGVRECSIFNVKEVVKYTKTPEELVKELTDKFDDENYIPSDSKYLLTYQMNGKGWGTFSWFNTIEELQSFVSKHHPINIIGAYHIKDAEETIEY